MAWNVVYLPVLAGPALVRRVAHHEGCDGWAARAAIADAMRHGRASSWARTVGEAATAELADAVRVLWADLRRRLEPLLAWFRRVAASVGEGLRQAGQTLRDAGLLDDQGRLVTTDRPQYDGPAGAGPSYHGSVPHGGADTRVAPEPGGGHTPPDVADEPPGG